MPRIATPKNLSAGHSHGFCTDARHDFAAEPRNTDFQSLEILYGFDFPVVPAAHLSARVADLKRFYIEDGGDLVPKFLTTAVIDSGRHLARRHTEGDGSEEIQRPGPVLKIIFHGVVHVRRAAGHRVKGFRRRHQFTGGIDLDL